MYLNAQQLDPSRGSDGTDVKLRGTRCGALYEVPWIHALCLEGRVFGVQFGSANKNITLVGTFGNAGATIDLDEFDLLQTIPATVGILPIYFKVAFSIIGTIAEAGAALAWGAAGVAGANPVAMVPYNMRPGSSNVSACTIVGLCDDGGSASFVPAGVIYREASTSETGAATEPAQLGLEWSAATAGFVPVVEGLRGIDRQIAGWAKAQAGAGWINYVFAELPVSAIN